MKKVSKKIFPYGWIVFVATEFANWFLDHIFDSINLSFLCYILIIIYIIYASVIIHKFKYFEASPGIQWLLLIIIPICSLLLSLSLLWIKAPGIPIFDLLKTKENSFFLSITFSLFSLIAWGAMLIGKQFIIRWNYFAYSVTCIPIKEGSNSSKMTVCLIKNNSHSKAPWMFPGGHVNLQNSRINEKNIVLSDISETPEKIIVKKAEGEAGLNKLKLLSIDNAFRADIKRLNTSWSLNNPAFTYLFRVSEDAYCRKIQQHHVHLDFTYVGTYKDVNKPQYTTYEFEFSPNSLSHEASEAIANINLQLSNGINKEMKNSPNLASHDLFPDSIPEMIYSASKYYEIYDNASKSKSTVTTP